MKLSPTAVSLFHTCPYAFYLQYIRRIETYEWAAEGLMRGRAVHKVIETYYSIIPQNITEREIEIYLAIACKKQGVQYKGKMARNLAAFAKFERARLRVGAPKPVSVEERYEKKIFHGVIDAIIEYKGRWIIDWKTGYSSHSLTEAHLIQGAIYQYLTNADKVFFIFLQHERYTELPVDEARQLLASTLQQLIKAKREKRWEKRRSNYCFVCPVSVYCGAKDEGVTIWNFS